MFFRCIFILDTSAPAFDIDIPLYYQQLNKNLVMNVYSNGQWGSYRHLPLHNGSTVTVPHAFVNTTTLGDLSSLKWVEGNLQPDRCVPLAEVVNAYIHISLLHSIQGCEMNGEYCLLTIAHL
jgi:hypothetical protein